MMDKGLTEEEIRERGIIWDVPGVLDDAEDREPAGHWLNTSGRRVYAPERVELAEELLKNRSGNHFVSPRALEINTSSKPFTPAIFIFDYRTIVKKLDHELHHQIWRERLSHPVAGRIPGAKKRELELVKEGVPAPQLLPQHPVLVVHFADLAVLRLD